MRSGLRQRVTAHADTKKPKFQYVPRPETTPKKSWWLTDNPLDRDGFMQNFQIEKPRIIKNSSPLSTASEVGSGVELASIRRTKANG